MSSMTPATRAALPEHLRTILDAVEDRKAREVTVLDLRGVNNAIDFFVIASGTSDTHVRGMADLVQERMQHAGWRPHHVEGLAGGRWVLLDYIDVVVHLFHPEARAFYQLERLWGDAPELTLSG